MSILRRHIYNAYGPPLGPNFWGDVWLSGLVWSYDVAFIYNDSKNSISVHKVMRILMSKMSSWHVSYLFQHICIKTDCGSTLPQLIQILFFWYVMITSSLRHFLYPFGYDSSFDAALPRHIETAVGCLQHASDITMLWQSRIVTVTLWCHAPRTKHSWCSKEYQYNILYSLTWRHMTSCHHAMTSTWLIRWRWYLTSYIHSSPHLTYLSVFMFLIDSIFLITLCEMMTMSYEHNICGVMSDNSDSFLITSMCSISSLINCKSQGNFGEISHYVLCTPLDSTDLIERPEPRL